MERAGHDRRQDDGIHGAALDALQLHQLKQPDGIFVRRAARIGGDPPAGALGLAVIKREDHVRVPDIDG